MIRNDKVESYQNLRNESTGRETASGIYLVIQFFVGLALMFFCFVENKLEYALIRWKGDGNYDGVMFRGEGIRIILWCPGKYSTLAHLGHVIGR